MFTEASIQSKLFFAGTKPHFRSSKKGAYFSVTSIALNDVNVRGGSVLKPFARDIGTSQKFVSL